MATIISRCKPLLSCRQIFQLSKAFLNARRKAQRTRFCLEPKRRLSAILENPNSHLALVNGPDYTFLDKRPTPYGIMQYKRICKNREITAQIVQSNKEIDMALQFETEEAARREAEIQDILNRKLKPKGGVIGEKQKKV